MERILISKLESSPFHHSDVVKLLHLSFQERTEAGLCFTCSTMTEAEYLSKVKDGTVLVAVAQSHNELAGTASVVVAEDHRSVKFGHLQYLAVHPEYKRMGIATDLFHHILDMLSVMNVKYIMSDTATAAKSSVRWHKNNGFSIIGLKSYPQTNYYSYVFRYDFEHRFLYRQIKSIAYFGRLVLSYVYTRTLFKQDGSLSDIGRIAFSRREHQ